MRQIDGKYQTSGDITKLDGTAIPADEPLVLFRAQDKLLPQLLQQYAELCKQAGSPEAQVSGILKQVETINKWQAAHSDRVKVPD